MFTSLGSSGIASGPSASRLARMSEILSEKKQPKSFRRFASVESVLRDQVVLGVADSQTR
jgi:hypothetical protein